MEIPPLIGWSTLAFIVACWATDLRSRNIPNLLTGSALVLGLGLNLWFFGPSGLLHSLLGALLTGTILFGPFVLGGVGGGDVKMMAAVGALLGPRMALVGLAAGLILGGVFMILHLARIGRVGEKLRSTARMVANAVGGRSVEALRISDRSTDAVTLPYSVPLGVGTLGAMFMMRAL